MKKLIKFTGFLIAVSGLCGLAYSDYIENRSYVNWGSTGWDSDTVTVSLPVGATSSQVLQFSGTSGYASLNVKKGSTTITSGSRSTSGYDHWNITITTAGSYTSYTYAQASSGTYTSAQVGFGW